MTKNDVEGLRVEQSIQAQAQDAVVWASQHGLVRLFYRVEYRNRSDSLMLTGDLW